jgi:hypothetical protein
MPGGPSGPAGPSAPGMPGGPSGPGGPCGPVNPAWLALTCWSARPAEPVPPPCPALALESREARSKSLLNFWTLLFLSSFSKVLADTTFFSFPWLADTPAPLGRLRSLLVNVATSSSFPFVFLLK